MMLTAAAALMVWHMVLTRQDLDHPGLVAARLIILFAAWAPLVRKPRTLAAGALVVGLVFVFHWGYERAASDGREYFVQVRSLVFDRDLDFRNENAVFGVRGTAKMYPFGAAFLWAPFMVLAHLWLKLLNLFGGAFSTDGLTNPYQRAIGLGSLIYGVAGLVLIWRIIRDYFGEPIAAIASLAIAAGTFFPWYLVVENSMVHGPSLFATMLFLWVWYRGRPAPANLASGLPAMGWWIALGLTGGFMTMVRWQNITFVLLAVALSAWALRGSWLAAARGLAACAAAGLIAFSPQLVFWKVVRGGWLDVPAADHNFSLRALHVWDVLFSSNHGLLATTPLVYVALLGLPLFIRRDRSLALVLILGLASQVVINSGNDGWWGGPGFGARRFDNCLLVFGIGLAALLAWLRDRPLVAPVAVISAFVAGNLVVMADVHSRVLPSSDAVTFMDAMRSVHARVGNPFSFPYSAYVAWRYDADLALVDRLRGRTYNNLDIDFGDAGDETLLGRGWFPAERNEARTFRWATGPASSIVVPLKSGDAYRLEVACEPFAPPGALPQVLTVVINRREVASVTLDPVLRTYAIAVPAGAFHPDLNLLQFVFAHAISPAQAGLTADTRPLAALFDTLTLRRVTGGAP